MAKEKVNVRISYSNYSTDCINGTFKKGDRFISVNVDTRTSGMGYPCKNRKDAVDSIYLYLFDNGLFNEKIIWTDETDLNITFDEVRLKCEQQNKK